MAENMPDGPESVILESVLEGMAEYYSLQLSQNVKRGLLENAKNHKSVSGSPPFGYRLTPDKHFEPDPETAPTVRVIFEKYASDKLPEWKAEAELFFYHFDSVGWMGTSNRKIQDWESRANLWISDKALALKNGEREKQAEIDARNLRSYGRTTGLPEEGQGEKASPTGGRNNSRKPDDGGKDYTKGF